LIIQGIKHEDEIFFRYGYCSYRIHEQRSHETKEISENTYMDIEEKGNIVNMTIEHAKDSAGLWEFSYQEMSRQTA